MAFTGISTNVLLKTKAWSIRTNIADDNVAVQVRDEKDIPVGYFRTTLAGDFFKHAVLNYEGIVTSPPGPGEWGVSTTWVAKRFPHCTLLGSLKLFDQLVKRQQSEMNEHGLLGGNTKRIQFEDLEKSLGSGFTEVACATPFQAEMAKSYLESKGMPCDIEADMNVVLRGQQPGDSWEHWISLMERWARTATLDNQELAAVRETIKTESKAAQETTLSELVYDVTPTELLKQYFRLNDGKFTTADREKLYWLNIEMSATSKSKLAASIFRAAEKVPIEDFIRASSLRAKAFIVANTKRDIVEEDTIKFVVGQIRRCRGQFHIDFSNEVITYRPLI